MECENPRSSFPLVSYGNKEVKTTRASLSHSMLNTSLGNAEIECAVGKHWVGRSEWRTAHYLLADTIVF